MCLVKVKQEEDVVVPYRPARAHSTRRSTHRVSREVIRESRPASSGYFPHRPPSQTYVAVPAPRPLAIPAPQPVPVFVQPPPPPPAPPSHISSHHGGGAHYVEVSPRSSVTSHSPSRSDYVVHEREYRRERRERDYSPESSPRYETFRYVEGAEEPDRYDRYQRRERSRSRVRARSRSRDYGYEDPRGSYRETNTRIIVNDGRRRSEYAL